MTDSEKLDMILNSLQGIKADNEVMKTDIANIKADNEVMKTDIADIKADNEKIKSDIVNIKMTLENDISPRLQNIESCYTSTYERYKDGIEEHEAMKSDIEVMKKVIEKHSGQLQQLA